LCGNFILPEPASYVFFYAFSNLRNLLYIITEFGLLRRLDPPFPEQRQGQRMMQAKAARSIWNEPLNKQINLKL